MSLTIGCDPELICRVNGSFVPAHKYFKSNSSFGLDGNEVVAELRPGYSESPIDLTAKIRHILELGSEKHPNLQFISGHYVDHYSIGGHIHLSVPPKESVIDNLDTVLGALSDCIDDREQRQRRQESGYGKKSSYRTKQYGMEYRMPGSWLLSPSTTLITLTLAKLSVLSHTEDGIDLSSIKSRQTPQHFLRKLRKSLKTIPSDCYEGLLELDFLLDKQLDWNQNILPFWGINSANENRRAA